MSSTGLKGLPADNEAAPKEEGFDALRSQLSVAVWPHQSTREIAALYPNASFNNDGLNFTRLDHLVRLAPGKADYPRNVTDAIQ
jgi:hypothetical protein